MKSSVIIAILATAQAALASPHLLQSRADSGVICDRPKHCNSWYLTGSAQCKSGYKRTHATAKGYAAGSYCERMCNTQERTDCTAKKCADNEQQCNMYPRSPGSCASAMSWCDGPISMVKSSCTAKNMHVQVTFDSDKNICIPQGKTIDSRKPLPLRLGPGDNFAAEIYDPAVQGYKQMVCRGSTYANALALEQKAADATLGCVTTYDDDEGNSGYGGHNIKCKTTKGNFAKVEKVLEDACNSAPSFNGNKVYFRSDDFYGQPR